MRPQSSRPVRLTASKPTRRNGVRSPVTERGRKALAASKRAMAALGVLRAIALSGCGVPASPPTVGRASRARPCVPKASAADPRPRSRGRALPCPTFQNALQSAQSYIDTMAFSKHGLIGQLASSAGEGYPRADAIYAANHVKANWNEEAVESAQGYLDMGGMSRSGLTDQLTSSAGEGYTQAQALYAVGKVYG